MLDYQGKTMPYQPTLARSPYHRRIGLVQDAIMAHSALDEVDAGELAVHVLHALDTIPEQMR